MWYTRNIFIYFFINWTLRMNDNLPERVQILCHTHIICITVLEHRIICCQIFCALLLKSAFEWIFNVMELILVKIKWHIKWKYLIQKFHDICLSYYFKYYKLYFLFCILCIERFDNNSWQWPRYSRNTAKVKHQSINESILAMKIVYILKSTVTWSIALLLFSEGIFHPVVSASALTWFIRYIYAWNLYLLLQSNLSYVTFQGNIEIGSHKTDGRLIQV